jgi:hypothetical protein
MMDPKIIWSKFILAQQKILESKSLPVSVDPETISIKNNRITINADADAYKKILIYDLQRLFCFQTNTLNGTVRYKHNFN